MCVLVRARQREQQHLLQLKERSDERARKLSAEITAMKASKVALLRRIREEAASHRRATAELDREIVALKRQQSKAGMQVVKLAAANAQQQVCGCGCGSLRVVPMAVVVVDDARRVCSACVCASQDESACVDASLHHAYVTMSVSTARAVLLCVAVVQVMLKRKTEQLAAAQHRAKDQLQRALYVQRRRDERDDERARLQEKRRAERDKARSVVTRPALAVTAGANGAAPGTAASYATTVGTSGSAVGSSGTAVGSYASSVRKAVAPPPPPLRPAPPASYAAMVSQSAPTSAASSAASTPVSLSGAASPVEQPVSASPSTSAVAALLEKCFLHPSANRCVRACLLVCVQVSATRCDCALLVLLVRQG